MKDVYEVLRHKELEVSRLQKEVAAPLLLADGEAKIDSQSTLQRAVNDKPQPDHSGGKTEAKSSGRNLI
jgi:hypothetical protein